MKTIKKASKYILSSASLIALILITIALNPVSLYAKSTTLENFTIYHTEPLPKQIKSQLYAVNQLLQESELYSEKQELNICLNDGSFYPAVIKQLKGDAFAHGFHKQIVLTSDIDYNNNTACINGHKWNLTQLLAHEAIHCLQYQSLGLLNSKPFAKIDNWKWEGYAEYISRKAGYNDLRANIKTLINLQKENKAWIVFPDETECPTQYFNDYVLVQYALDVKDKTFRQLLSSDESNNQVYNEMIEWHKKTESTL